MFKLEQLTQDAKIILKFLYKYYLNSISNGLSKSQANYFEDSNFIMDNLPQHFTSEDISAICWDLHNQGYLSCFPGEDLANDISLTSKAIAYMENKNFETFKNVFNSATKLIP